MTRPTFNLCVQIVVTSRKNKPCFGINAPGKSLVGPILLTATAALASEPPFRPFTKEILTVPNLIFVPLVTIWVSLILPIRPRLQTKSKVHIPWKRPPV